MATKVTKIIISIFIIIIAISYLFIPLLNKDYFTELDTIDEFHSINSGFIYFGSTDCPSCVGFKPILEKYAQKNMYKIYYFNFKHFTENNLITKEELNKIIEDYKIEQIPILIEVRNKEIKGSMIAQVYSIRGAEHVIEQLKIFFEGSPFKNVPLFDIHNIINIVIYISFWLIIIVSFFISRKYSKVIYLLAFILLICNCINMWNYGVYIDKNNALLTYHIGYLGWINVFLALVTFITKIILKEKKYDEEAI